MLTILKQKLTNPMEMSHTYFLKCLNFAQESAQAENTRTNKRNIFEMVDLRLYVHNENVDFIFASNSVGLCYENEFID